METHMGDREAVAVLLRLREKYPLTEEEREAIGNATGILSWAALYESSVQNRKAKRLRDMEVS